MAAHAELRNASGFVAPGFERLAELFSERLGAMRGGASLSIHVAGRSVARLWGGNRRSTGASDEWSGETLVNLFSVVKPIYTLCILALVDRRQMALEDPVSLYWPEFAANGKAEITVRQVLSHTAGLPSIREPLDSRAVFDRERMCRCLENESPWWPPGSKRGVLAHFYCHLLSEVVRRVARVPIEVLWRNELAPALDAADVFFGVPEFEHGRIAECLEFTPAEKAAYLSDPQSLLYKVMTSPPVAFETQVLNSPQCWNVETSGFGTAEAVARVFDLLALVNAGPPRALSTPLLREALRVQSEGFDEVLGRTKRWCLGMQAFGATGWIGMGGIGGTLAVVHPETATSFVFLPNGMGDWRHSLVLLNLLSQLLGTASL